MHADEQPSVQRRPSFPQPDIRTTHYERDEFGIVSPSDLRRPREESHKKMASELEKNDTSAPELHKSASGGSKSHTHARQESKIGLENVHVRLPTTSNKSSDSSTKAKEAINRESTFIDAFFGTEPEVSHDTGDSKSWRQTSLQRRSVSSDLAVSRSRISPMNSTDTAANTVSTSGTFTIPSTQALVDNYPYPRTQFKSEPEVKATKKTSQGPFEGSSSVGSKVATAPPDDGISKVDSVSGPRPKSERLRKLPADDIDLLTADDIRATMGRKHNNSPRGEGKEQDRQKLEAGYITAKPPALDEVVEGHVLNNHFVRRTQQEFERANFAAQTAELNTNGIEQSAQASQPESIQMESSIDRMRRWIEEGGTSLAKHFWQDPIEAGAPTEADLQFIKQLAGVTKGRRAREVISDDLETDLPVCKGLLERLKNDERKVEHAALRLRTPQKTMHGTEMPKNLKAIRDRRLRNTYERTEKQLQSACQALRDLNSEAIQKSTNAFKRRLGIASRILHKNHTLTRMLTWSAQARLDEVGVERNKAERYSEILTHLATLRDTQLALARLMDHAIQTYGVSLKPADEALSKSSFASEPEVARSPMGSDFTMRTTAGTKFLAETAAAASLIDEVQSHKAAMQGLSDDGYARESKPAPRQAFEEHSPLAHSLFRPFTSQLESLGDKAVSAKDPEQWKVDQDLVREVRNTCKNSSGPTTTDQLQVPEIEENVNQEAKNSIASAVSTEDQSHFQAVDAERNVESVQEDYPHNVQGSITAIEDNVATASAPGVIVDNSALLEPTPGLTRSHSSHEEKTAIASDNTNTKTDQGVTPASNLPTYYTILIYDPRTDKLSVTTSTSGPPRDTAAALPIHQALSTLKHPEVFIPHITPGLDVVNARRHMLVLRDALDETSSTRTFETLSTHPVKPDSAPVSAQMNPIDGTPRLSPTGYSGVEQSREQLAQDFEERRQASAAIEAASNRRGRQQTKEERTEKGKGGVSGVVKTAIWAGAVCYVIGVTAEVFR